MLQFHVVVAFVFVWSSSSLRGCLVCCFCVRVHLLMGVLFVVFVVITFVFAWWRSQMDELVSWLPKPILVLLEGGAA